MSNHFPEVLNRIKELRSLLERHNRLYYVDAKPEITDREYDGLMARLIALEKANPELITVDSPSVKVGGEPSAGFTQVSHRIPMLSIENAFDEQELVDWDAGLRKTLDRESLEYSVEFKIDGVAIALIWENGTLVRAATRGNGAVGDDVTNNARVIAGIPLRLMTDKPPASLEVRGEVIILNEQFAVFQADQVRNDEEPFENPRNAAAGALKLLDPRLTRERKLRFLAYGVGYVDGISWTSHSEFLGSIRSLGIPTTPNVSRANGFEELMRVCAEMIALVPELPFEVDGLVIKLNNLADREKLRATSKHLRWARAYKWGTQDLGAHLGKLPDDSAGTGSSSNTLAGILAGKTVVVSGTMVRLTRDEVEQLIRDHGGNTSVSISLETDLVVAGNDAGSQLTKAQELNLIILTEDEFLATLHDEHVMAPLDEAISQLNSMIGLSGVKGEVKRLMSFLKIQQERRRHGLRESGQTLHFVFTGNPGTGKTTVARIISKILYGFGLLKSSKVIECDRSDLIGGYLGQTAMKTDEKIESALDGVLFIDEAYTLAGDALNYGHGDMYGDEAINTLLKRMEDSRDRLVVIVAGYPAPMQKFIRANPGLESRFTRYINFEDYSVSDLCQIFEKFCRDAEYSLSASARVWASILFTIAYNQRDERFGNARFIRNVFERATSLHSDRLADVPVERLTKEMLVTLDGNDLSFEFVKKIDRNQIGVSDARWLAECPNCGTKSRGTGKALGHRTSCKKCGQAFLFPWWSLEPNTVKGVSAELLQGSNDQRGIFEAKTVEAKPLRTSSTPVEAPALLVLPPSDGWAEDPIRGQALLAEGMEYLQHGNATRAIRCFDDAIKADWDGSNPSNQHYFLYRAKAYELEGQERPMQALAEYNAAARAWSLGHYRESQERFLQSIELDPEFPWASNNLAWRFATAADAAARNGTKAVQQAICACRKADWHCWAFIDTLAASYAEVGEFSMAIKCSERALLLAPSRCRRGLEEMLEYFRAGKPFRDNTK